MQYPHDIDKEFVPYLDMLNKIPGIWTTQCCCGHGKKMAHLSLEINWDFYQFWFAIKDIMNQGDEKTLSVSGFLKGRPRFVFYFSHTKFPGFPVALYKALNDEFNGQFKHRKGT